MAASAWGMTVTLLVIATSVAQSPRASSPVISRDGAILEQRPLPPDPRFGEVVEWHRLVYASDHLRVVGFLVQPSRRAGKLPVLIYNRGGNRTFGEIVPPDGGLSELAANGYVVLASQYRGAGGGEGRDEFGGADLHDVLNLIPLARNLPWADPERMVMLGESRGGMMTYLAIKSEAPIKAAVVVCAPSDLFDCYRERPGLARVLRELIGGSPREAPKAYRERSAYFWPEKLTVPLLILHCTADWRVPCSHSCKLAARLRALGMPHELVTFPGDHHGLEAHRTKRDSLILQWFRTHLESNAATARMPALEETGPLRGNRSEAATGSGPS